MSLRIVPVTLESANAFVRSLHRHSRPVVGHKFSVGVADGDKLVGVAICGRPVARELDDGTALEITRVCTDGTRNACSMLYAACRKAGRALGHDPILTYTLPEEGGASLRAAGFTLEKTDAGNKSAAWHNRTGRKVQMTTRSDQQQPGAINETSSSVGAQAAEQGEPGFVRVPRARSRPAPPAAEAPTSE